MWHKLRRLKITAYDDKPHIVTSLLLEEAQAVAPALHWLVLGGEAALSGSLTGIAPNVHWWPVDVRERNRVSVNVVVSNDIHDTSYERVLVPLPPERNLARRWLLTARNALVPGGLLIVAGANAEGAKSALSDATMLLGASRAERYRRKHRIAHFAKDADRETPPWTGAAGITPGTWQRFDVDLDEGVLSLETQPGVFAGDRLDSGTRLLLDHLEVPDDGRVLDVGCGVGVIGIAASRRGAGHVDLVDANLLAVETASRNLERLDVAGRAIASDVFSGVPGERYDVIVSNPPFHRGKQVDYSTADRLISETPRHLERNGSLMIVANAFLAYGKRLERVFRRVETVAATRQYQVLVATEPR